MATNPDPAELPPLPPPQVAWFDPRTGQPTPEFARIMTQWRAFLVKLQAYIAQELP